MTATRDSADACIVIAAFNAEEHIGEALTSVLEQSRPPREIVVVDDGSEDATAQVAASFPGVGLVSQANRGPAAARNAGVARTTAALIGFLDADDLMTPRRLELQTARMCENPDLEVVFGAQEVRLEPGAALPFWAEGSAVPARRIGPGEFERVYHLSMLLRRGTWERVGPFDESLRQAEDLDWTLRASEAGARMEVLDDVVTIRRVHGGNVTHDAEGSRAGIFSAFRKRIERNRAREDAAPQRRDPGA